MLPAPPKTFGMLGEVLISALKSVSGEANSLELPKRRSVCVVLVDGLGSLNLKDSGAHAGFLNSQKIRPASCFYPSTTATSIVSFATGKPPWVNGFVGYTVFDKPSGKSMNLLSGWNSQEDAKALQTQETVSEKAKSSGIEFHTISQAQYEKSGFTAATTRESNFHGIANVADRFAKARTLLADPKPKVIYLYIPELDQTAHSKGWKSNAWLNLLESVDAELFLMNKELPKSSGVILTSDHGVIDIPISSHIYLDEVIDTDELHAVGGDTRGLFLYLKDPSSVERVTVLLEHRIGDTCYVVSPETLVSSGYWGEIPNANFLPDLVVIAKKEVALFHRGFAKAKSLNMIGHHGAISTREMSIPLITIGFS
jgi:predicted AlkP superfamily pyrophosphatase or phosphodiesterase